MRLLSFALLLLVRLGVATQVYTLSQVQDQISAYLNETGQHEARSETQCNIACGFLRFTLPQQLAYPDSTAYEFQESRYWSQQQALTEPSCRFSPKNAPEVSLAVLTSRVTKCKFAVKSGGHAAFAGASNIQDGLTIDLINLDEVTLSADKTQASVGAGNVWYDVYQQLQPKGVTVIGGRVSAIGVGGLTLGGGISFFSNRHGWACDNVNAYEIVLADGTIRTVSYRSSYSDLFWALRGGGNNFGIVTRFDLAAYDQGDMWAGSRTLLYSNDTATAINQAFYDFTDQSASDPYAQIIIAYAYAQSEGVYVIAEDLQYGKPQANPPIFHNFTAIPGAVADTLRVVDQLNLTVEFNNTNPGGFRQSYWAFAFENNAELMGDIVSIYMEEVEKVKDAAGIVPSAVFQPITTEMIGFFSKNGGNPLGITSKVPLNLVNIDISWSNVADDQRILTAAQNMVDRSVALAKSKGLDNQYLYQNYASQKQDVFGSYGKANLDRLRSIAAKYDPTKVFQTLQPGYFKLG